MTDVIHQGFLARLPESERCEEDVAARHALEGWIGVTLERHPWSPVRRSLPGQKDVILFLDISGEVLAHRVVIEVKSRDFEFDEDPASYPYPTAFVGSVEKWEEREGRPRPVACVVMSQLTRAMLVVDAATFPSWRALMVPDRKRGFSTLQYEAPSDNLITWEEHIVTIRRLQEAGA